MDDVQEPQPAREADALRRDRERADRAVEREAAKARRDAEKAEQQRAKDEAKAVKDRERLERAQQKAVDDLARQRAKAEETSTKESAARARELERREDEIRRELERREQEAVKEAERARADRERQARDAAKEAGRALREAEKAQRAAALAEQRAAREAEKARRQAQRADLYDGPAPTQDLSALPPDVAVLWRQPEPPRRGPRPGLSLDVIADAAIALADAEGIGAVSMARLAESLGFTTMSLYRYVSSKDEVLALMSDRAGGRPPRVGPEVGDWRARLELLLALSARMLRSHPWLAQTSSVLYALGPNRLAWMEAMVGALDDVPLAPAQKVLAVGLLSSHQIEELRLVAAMVERERQLTAAGGPGVYDVLPMLLSPQEHPALQAVVAAGGFAAPPPDALDADVTSFGTRVILDGIAQMIEAASRPQAGAASPGPQGGPDGAPVSDVTGRIEP